MIWTNEDGDDYFASGHRTRDEMVQAIIEFERECVRAVITPDDFSDAQVRHYWVRWVDEEHGEVAEPGSPGSEKITKLSPDFDWMTIEDRGDAVDSV